MRPKEFSTLAAIDEVYRDDQRLHRKIYQSVLELMLDTPALSAHREYVAKNLLGFGDYAFHGAWSLLVDAMPDTFRFLEIGVYKGNILSLVGMLAHRRGKNSFVVGVSPFNGEGERYGDFGDEDCIAAVNALEEWCHIPRPRRARLIEGQSQDLDVLDACRAGAPYDIVFIDGSRDYEQFATDLINYGELVGPGGYLVLYRASDGLDLPPHIWPGDPDIARAIATVIDPDPRFRHVAAFGHMRVWTKRASDPVVAAALAAQEIPVEMRFAPAETRRFGDISGGPLDLVMTFASNYRFTEIEPFVASLLNYGRNIHLVVFANHMDEAFHLLAERLNIEVIPIQAQMLREYHVCNLRFQMFDEYLRATVGRWRNVLISDVRDVVFQSDPFEVPFPAPVVFAAEDSPIAVSGMNHQWLKERYSTEIADALAASPTVCAGTTIGTVSGITTYVDTIWREIASDTYDHIRPYDQGSHNYIAWHLRPEWAVVDLEDRIMATIGTTQPERISIVNGLIMIDGKAPPVVHQWDRKPGLVGFINQSPHMHLKT